MDLFPHLFFCLLIFSGAAFSQQTGSEVTRKIINEDKDILLDCAFNGRNIKDEVFEWSKDGTEVFAYGKRENNLNDGLNQDPPFKGRVSFFPEQLAVGNASIVIRKAQVKDNGTYICIFPFHKPMTRAQFELTVEWILKPRNIPGAVQQPIVTVEETNNGMVLQCDVRGGFPKPKVEWWDSAGNILDADEPQITERGGSYNIILQTTVTKSDHYRCVATQEEIYSQIFTKTFVRAPEFPDEENVVAAVLGVGFVLLLLLLLVVLVVLLKKKAHTRITHTRHSLNSLQLPDDPLKEALTV